MFPFRYHRATDLEEASRLLREAEDGKAIAGGQSLVPIMKQRFAQPTDLIDIGGIPGLDGVTRNIDTLEIGALARHHRVAEDATVRASIPALAELAGGIGDPQVRNVGTIGGSLAHADPAADYPAAALALDAEVITDRRAVLADGFFAGMFETALEEDELIRSVRLRIPVQAGYVKFPNPASRYPIVGAFAARFADGVRVAITGASDRAFRVAAFEQALGEDFRPAALEGLSVEFDDFNTDLHASAEYRAHLVGVMARRAVESALG